MTSALDDHARGQCLLSAIYMNTPELLIQDRSRIHRGGLVLEVCGDPVKRLEGFYWTDRGIRGQLDFDQHTSAVHEDYRSAQAASYGPQPAWPARLWRRARGGRGAGAA